MEAGHQCHGIFSDTYQCAMQSRLLYPQCAVPPANEGVERELRVELAVKADDHPAVELRCPVRKQRGSCANRIRQFLVLVTTTTRQHDSFKNHRSCFYDTKIHTVALLCVSTSVGATMLSISIFIGFTHYNGRLKAEIKYERAAPPARKTKANLWSNIVHGDEE